MYLYLAIDSEVRDDGEKNRFSLLRFFSNGKWNLFC